MSCNIVKSLSLAIGVFLCIQASAQVLQQPPVEKFADKSGILKIIASRQQKEFTVQGRDKAIMLAQQKDCDVYALPLDGTRCLVSRQEAYKNFNAWKPDVNDSSAGTIPNALGVNDIIPQRTTSSSLQSK